MSPIRAENFKKPCKETTLEATERTENTMANLVVMGATVARWIGGRSEIRAQEFREKGSRNQAQRQSFRKIG